MTVRIAEVRAPAVALAVVGLVGLPAGRVGVVGDAAALDAGEGGVELLLADQERVVVRAEVVRLVVVQGDPVGQRDGDEMRRRRVGLQAEDAGQELRQARGSRAGTIVWLSSMAVAIS